jgi:hypothetical protein
VVKHKQADGMCPIPLTTLQAPRSASDVEKEQEALLQAKYGGLSRKKKMSGLLHKVGFAATVYWAGSGQHVTGQRPVAHCRNTSFSTLRIGRYRSKA